MRSLVLVLLIAAAGCATPRTPEPMVSAPEKPSIVRPETAQPTPALTPAPPPVQEPASVEQKPAPLTSAPPSPAVHVPAQQPEARVEQSSTPDQRPVAAEPREYPVPYHKLQKLIELAASNDEKMLHVYIGIYRKTVERIMENERNPYRKRTITGKDGNIYEVLFYLTREPRQGRPVTDRMLTPVIFKDDRVAGIGNYQLKKLMRDGTLERRKTAAAAAR